MMKRPFNHGYKKTLDAERLRKLIRYEPESGKMIWLESRGSVISGSMAGVVNHDGYRHIKVCGRIYMAHRLAWLYMTGENTVMEIDHINGDKLDNRWSNLRAASREENQWNTVARSNNSSKLKGASRHKQSGKWTSEISAGGNKKYLGIFNSPEEAHAAYCAASANMHGKFSNTGKRGQK